MKFTDGAWLMRPGVQAHYATEVNDVVREGDSLAVYAPTRPIRHRGDTLQGPLLTLRIDSPAEGVIRVRIEHFTGERARGPRLAFQPLPPPKVEVSLEEDAATLTSSGLTARIERKNGWELSFRQGGRVLTRSGWRGAAYMQGPGADAHVVENLSLGVGECVYGLGERFTAFVKNGQAVEIANRDGGTGSDQAYKNVPFYLTNRGYGVLINETRHVSLEVATEKVSRVQFSAAGESLEYLVFLGPDPKDVLRRLTALTGRPALPPAWSFGLWLSTSFTTNYDEATVMGIIEGMKSRDLPLHVFHFDCFWMREFNWCDFTWDPRVFPDPAGLLARLRERGLRISLWLNPYVAQRSPLFAEGAREGYFIRRTDGSVWQTDLWQPGMAIVDFTNPAAAGWFAGHVTRLLQMGVDAIKTDFGERIPTEGVVYHDGADPARMHNFYSLLYNECVFRAVEAARGRGEAVLFARSSYATGQRFPVHWGGDCWSTMESMAESLRGGLSLGLCGFGFWSHDIGGFEGTAPAYVYKRWAAFGLLSSHSRLHGSGSYRVPWAYDDEACDVVRFFTKLKCRLMPTLWHAAVAAHREGLPVMRAMPLEYPDDPACDTLDRQYFLGPSLLVAPVFAEDGAVDYYLPQGRWVHLLTGESQEGGRWHRGRHGFLSLPLFIRPGHLVALGARDDRPDYDFAAGVTLRLGDLEDGAEAAFEIPARDGGPGPTAQARRSGRHVDFSWKGAPPPQWSAQVGTSPAPAPSGARTLRLQLPD
ncbi:MAG TPA: alpha-xylosidase [Opitutaceae bacterium]|nr:alpha-xylosidase [Opitutaceae bacterium]